MPLENMSDRELLEELVRREQSRKKWVYVKIVVAVIVIALLAVLVFQYIIPMVGYIEDIDKSMIDIQAEVDGIKLEADQMFAEFEEKLNEIDLEGINSFAEKLNSLNLDGVVETVEKLGNLINKFPRLFN